jgi:TRAP-type C4-dicarboxylate transport system permease small subunit
MWHFLFQLAAPAPCTVPTFFGLSPWYKYLEIGRNAVGVCEPKVEFIVGGNLDLTVITLVTLGILDILLRVAGLVAVGFIIYGGVLYVSSEGKSEKAKQALSTIINSLVGLGITIVAASTVAFLGTRLAGSAATTATGLPQLGAGDSQIQTILAIFFAVLAAATLLVVVIAGFRYMTSAGDPSGMSSAKNTIIYASIGLVISLAAFSIVAFVLNNL